MLGRVLDHAVATAGRQRAVRIARAIRAGVVGGAQVASLAAGDDGVAADAVANALRGVESAKRELVV